MDVTRTLLALAALPLLAACGSNDSADYNSAASVAKAAHCSGYQAQEPELFAADAGTCQHNGHRTTVQWFKTSDLRDSWAKAADTFGVTYLAGDTWVIECDTRPDCETIRASVGGTLN